MKRVNLALVAALLVIGLSSAAFATPSLSLSSGVSSAVVVGSDITNSVSYSNPNFNGWNLQIVFGSSNSPALQGVNGLFGLDVTSLTATCTGLGACSSDTLTIEFSDTDFTQVVGAGGFTTTYSSTQVGGSTTQTAWADTTNTLFGHSGLIGSVGPFIASDHGSVSGGGPAGPAAYSLTIRDVFDSLGGAASFSTDGNITAVPEPGSLMLLGSGLLGFAGFARRKFSKS
jgi:hypothetical protein